MSVNVDRSEVTGWENPRLELNINTMDPDLILAVVCLQRLQGTGVYGDGRVVHTPRKFSAAGILDFKIIPVESVIL